MSTLLTIQSSLFGEQGQSSALINRFVEHWLTQHPGGKVINRNLAEDPVPHLDLERFQAFTANRDKMTDAQHEAVTQSDALIAELVSADVILLGIPMYNFNIPSTLHTYFDHIARAGVTFRYSANGPEGLVKGKKAYVFVTRGGVYGESHAQTDFVRQFLGFIGITDVEFIHAEGLAMKEKAEKNLAAAKQRIERLSAVV